MVEHALRSAASTSSFAALQKLRMEEVAGLRCGVTREDVVACFLTVPTTHRRSKLPADAAWIVLDPTSPALLVWDWLMRALSLYMFCEVPLNIAFRSSVRLGAHASHHATACWSEHWN